ncbi:hypothetical protein Rsub_06283 [Raphidocelis subcapitata]|uniref:Uncharacterized protein n=1 Tax=Raphidocelis subcapitata TaxID=307507 RepID=A0A2V0P6R5_9CHLO|nr:hypothetical protein Rsub_06283 [Raphidocelis subcapitata]|eukprot:GBF93563.1 hypothetical protein Rsub_06283 [Raphidocelis subcapitata]
MFAREFIQIPTRQLPLSEDAQVLLARLMSGYGRDASLNAKERRAPGSVAAVQLPGSPRPGQGAPSWSEEDDTGTPYSRRSEGSEPGDVEMTARGGADGAAGGYGNDRVRRRNRAAAAAAADDGGDVAAAALQGAALAAAGAIREFGHRAGSAADAAIHWLVSGGDGPAPGGGGGGGGAGAGSFSTSAPRSLRLSPGAAGAAVGAPRGESAAAAAVGDTWRQLSGVTVSLVDRIRRAASQPALGAGPPGARAGFRDAADAVLTGG